MVEYEVKLAASRKVLERIETDMDFICWKATRLPPKKLVSHYYDTDDFKLLFNNLAFDLERKGRKKL